MNNNLGIKINMYLFVFLLFSVHTHTHTHTPVWVFNVCFSHSLLTMCILGGSSASSTWIPNQQSNLSTTLVALAWSWAAKCWRHVGSTLMDGKISPYLCVRVCVCIDLLFDAIKMKHT